MQGIHTALVTPFGADGGVDLHAYERLCLSQIEAGIHGLVVCGTTGETPTLTDDERWSLLDVALSVTKGRIPVTLGVGSNHTAGTVYSVEQARARGADAGLVVLPYYNKPNDAGLRAHVDAVCHAGLPIVLYHVPGRTAQHVSSSLLAELCDVSGVVALKEATGDLRYGTDVMASTGTPVLSGDDFSFLGLLAQGGHGCVSVVSNVAPRQTVEVYERFVAGDAVGARDTFSRLWPLITWLFSDTNPVPAKAALSELGVCRPDVRLPLCAYAGPSPRQRLRELGLLS
jgi:4-hydroxy-tetrahydrodipicolinate synthase